MNIDAPQLTDAQLHEIAGLVKNLSGIDLTQGKRELIEARLGGRVRRLGLRNFRDYIRLLQEDGGEELTWMLDALSTNVTEFFRQPEHFICLERHLLRVGGPRRLRIWSAGCSTGEEPYSVAITAAEALKDLRLWDVKILATDLSTRVLARAMQGEYGDNELKTLNPTLRVKYFYPSVEERRFCIHPGLRNLVSFARLNLFNSWPMRGPFDAIFCRNVMIYFDKPSQAALVTRFWDMLKDQGLLFIGHSESLVNIPNRFEYIQPAVYQKIGGHGKAPK